MKDDKPDIGELIVMRLLAIAACSGIIMSIALIVAITSWLIAFTVVAFRWAFS